MEFIYNLFRCYAVVIVIDIVYIHTINNTRIKGFWDGKKVFYIINSM